jgi:hypothetical protein
MGSDERVMRARVPGSGSTTPLQISLIYELLDAHDDTARLANDLQSEPMWRPHLDYLRALQRVGREMVARLELEVAR